MTKILAVIGFIVLYSIWLISPMIALTCLKDDDNDFIGNLAGIVYVIGAVVIGYILIKLVGI